MSLNNNGNYNFLPSLVIGICLGTVAGLLGAQKPGEELIKDIKDKSSRFTKKTKVQVEKINRTLNPNKEDFETDVICNLKTKSSDFG